MLSPRRRLPRLRASRASAAGYTAVEIMMAVTLMIIGSAAVMSLQKTSVTGNFDARETDVAASIARTWIDRIHRDAMQWTTPSPAYPSENNFANAKLLYTPLYGKWTLPSFEMGGNPETMSYAFDILGRDLSKGDATSTPSPVVFCVNYRLQWLVPANLNPAAGAANGPDGGLIRIDLRVLWPRDIVSRPAGDWCTAVSGLDNPETAPQPTYHAIYMTTTVRQGGLAQ